MSTASAQLLVTASAIANDFYANIIHPKAGDKELVLVSRIVVLLVALIAIYMAMDPDSYILTMVAYAWARTRHTTSSGVTSLNSTLPSNQSKI